MIMDIYDGRESMKDRPMKGFIQVLQVLLFFVGGIVIIAIIVNKSPATLFAGLGFSGYFNVSIQRFHIRFCGGYPAFCQRYGSSGDWVRFLPVTQMALYRK